MAFSLTFYLTCIFLFLFHFPRATVSALQEIWTNWQWDRLKVGERGRLRACEWDREWGRGSVAWDDRADIQPAIFAFGAFKKLIQITRAGSALARGRGSWAKKQENLEIRFFNILCSHHSILWPQNAHTHTRTQYKIHAKIHIYIKKIYILCVCGICTWAICAAAGCCCCCTIYMCIEILLWAYSFAYWSKFKCWRISNFSLKMPCQVDNLGSQMHEMDMWQQFGLSSS